MRRSSFILIQPQQHNAATECNRPTDQTTDCQTQQGVSSAPIPAAEDSRFAAAALFGDSADQAGGVEREGVCCWVYCRLVDSDVLSVGGRNSARPTKTDQSQSQPAADPSPDDLRARIRALTGGQGAGAAYDSVSGESLICKIRHTPSPFRFLHKQPSSADGVQSNTHPTHACPHQPGAGVEKVGRRVKARDDEINRRTAEALCARERIRTGSSPADKTACPPSGAGAAGAASRAVERVREVGAGAIEGVERAAETGKDRVQEAGAWIDGAGEFAKGAAAELEEIGPGVADDASKQLGASLGAAAAAAAAAQQATGDAAAAAADRVQEAAGAADAAVDAVKGAADAAADRVQSVGDSAQDAAGAAAAELQTVAADGKDAAAGGAADPASDAAGAGVDAASAAAKDAAAPAAGGGAKGGFNAIKGTLRDAAETLMDKAATAATAGPRAAAEQAAAREEVEGGRAAVRAAFKSIPAAPPAAAEAAGGVDGCQLEVCSAGGAAAGVAAESG